MSMELHDFASVGIADAMAAAGELRPLMCSYISLLERDSAMNLNLDLV